MKKLILLLILLSSINCFSQAPHDSLNCVKPKVFGRAVPVVEYEVVRHTQPRGKHNIEVITRLYVLHQGAEIFEIFAEWHGLVRNDDLLGKLYKRHDESVKKELEILGWH